MFTCDGLVHCTPQLWRLFPVREAEAMTAHKCVCKVVLQVSRECASKVRDGERERAAIPEQ